MAFVFNSLLALPGMLQRHFQSLAALAIRALAVLLGFVVTYLIGSNLGPEANGQYALITQSAMLLSVVAVGGIDLAAVRKLSEAVARGIPVERRTLFKLVGYSLSIAGAIALSLTAAGTFVLELLFKGKPPQDAVLFIIMILFARALTRLMSSILRSQKAYVWGQLVEVLFIPAITVAALMMVPQISVRNVLWVTAIGGLATGAVALLSSLRYTDSGPNALHVSMREVLRIAIPLWGVAIFLNLADWYSLACASSMLSVHAAGLYRVALQLASALGIITMGLLSVYSPQISAAYATRDMHQVARLARSATRLSMFFALPVAAVIFVFAPQILGLIGDEFASASDVVRIVIAGQAACAITGPPGLVLAMTGHERVNLLLTVISIAFLLVAMPVAAWLFGLNGIAAVATLVVFGRNIASFTALMRLSGINVITGTVRSAKFHTGPLLHEKPETVSQ